MAWDNNPDGMIAHVEQKARVSGSFVDRAIVREIKRAFARLAGRPSEISGVVRLAKRWEQGMPDLEVLDAVRRVNRCASDWKVDAPRRVFGEDAKRTGSTFLC